MQSGRESQPGWALSRCPGRGTSSSHTDRVHAAVDQRGNPRYAANEFYAHIEWPLAGATRGARVREDHTACVAGTLEEAAML